MSVEQILKDLPSLISEILIQLIYTIYTYLEVLVRTIIPQPLKSLKGEIVLVTGSAGGIGEQICLQLADAGATIICWDCSKANEKVVNLLKSRGAKAFGYYVDLADRNQIMETATKVKREVGQVTMLISNAGIARYKEFLNVSIEEFETIMNVNLTSHIITIKEFLPSMIQNGKGHIVSTCSVGGIETHAYSLPYFTSKFAVNGYMQALAKEMRAHPSKPDIKFSTIYPITVRTNILFGMVKITPRWWWHDDILLTPEYVGKLAVDGIRRNDVKIFCPPTARLFLWMKAFVPHKASLRFFENFEPKLEPLKQKS